MLASAPPSNRVHTGGGISVRVNGAAVDSKQSVIEDSVERFNGSVSNKDNTGNSSEWAPATITWRNGAQNSPDGSSNLVLKNNNNNNNNASSSVDISTAAPQLVHVIRVKPSDSGKESMDNVGNGTTAINKAQIRITAPNSGNYVNNNVGYCKDKISVMVGSPIKEIIKGEDERSSSGASSAPGSDCERSDSDREPDDGTDSGFCPSRRHCARVSVTTNNTTNHSPIPLDSSIKQSYDEPPVKANILYNGKENNVRLTIASYSDKESENKNVIANGDQWDMQFHLREFDSVPTDKKTDSEDVQSKIAAAHALLSGQANGTYSLKNRVRSSIVSLLVQSASNRNYDQEETGRIVFYTTSMGIVRTTSERCRKVRKILDTLMVKFEERDVFMNRGFQQEVRERLGTTRVIVPQVFVEGRHLGSAEVVEQLNEIGHLRELLRPYKRQSVGGTCQQCGGYRYLLCPICGGSKKSVTHRHHFSEDLVALRCVTCDESGLIRCPQCINGEG